MILHMSEGHIGKTLKQAFSADNLKALGVTMVSAGFVKGVAEHFEMRLDAAPNQAVLTITERAQKAALQFVGDTAAESTVGGKSFRKAFVNNARGGAGDLAQEIAASKIGVASKDKKIDQVTRYGAHALTGGLASKIRKKDWRSGAVGAVVAELTGDIYRSNLESNGRFDPNSKTFGRDLAVGEELAKFFATTTACLLDLDPAEAARSGGIAVRENAFSFAGKNESEELQQAAEKTTAGKLHKKIGDEVDAAVKSVGVPVDPDANDYEEICRRGPEFFARYCIERKEHQLGRTLRPEEIADTRWRVEIKYSIIYDAVNPSLATQAMRHGAQFLDNLSDLPFTMAEHMAVRMGADPAEVRGVRLLAEDALMITGAAGAARSVAQGIAKGVVKATAKKTAQTVAGAEAAAIGAEAASGARGVSLGANQNGPLELTIYGRPENVVKAGKTRPDMGEYQKTKGHHVHAKKAFEGHVNYDPKKGFSISNEFMRANNIDHNIITGEQRRLFDIMAKSGRPNTLQEHTKIAVEALVKANCPRHLARQIVSESVKNLKNSGVRKPTTIPWNSK